MMSALSLKDQVQLDMEGPIATCVHVPYVLLVGIISIILTSENNTFNVYCVSCNLINCVLKVILRIL